MKCTGVKYKGMYRCGKCMACRINDTSEKALRALYELDSCNCASFITLTYNDEHLPDDNSLKPEHLTNFWKLLRMNLQRKYHEFAPNIRYLACGEYGDRELKYFSPGAIKPHGRPHYHAIVFGLDNYNDEHRDILRVTWNKCDPWFFDKDRGRNSGMQEVTPDDIRYVAGYTQKKLSGVFAKEVYGEAFAPFGRMSQGLGLEFANKNKERLLTNGFTFFKGQKVSIPRYFCKKWDINKSELIDIGNVQFSQSDFDMLIKKFEADMKEKGIYKGDINEYIKNSAFFERRFYDWFEKLQRDYTDCIYQDFLQRQKIRGKL